MMKHFKPLTIAVVTLLAGAAMSPAIAQNDTQMDPTTLNRWTMMDTDNSTQVSMSEHARAARQMFIAADTDHDNMLSKQEARKHPDFVMNPKQFTQWWSRNDTNGDGALSMDEYGVAANRMFRLSDTNDDDRLDKDEWTHAMATARHVHGYGLSNAGN